MGIVGNFVVGRGFSIFINWFRFEKIFGVGWLIIVEVRFSGEEVEFC